MRATIKDVAKAAGVSTATVSYVMNNKKVNISDQTKAKVRQAAKALNYYPNHAAVSLATNMTNSIGLLISSATNPYLATLSNKIRLKLLDRGITLVIGYTDYNPETAWRYLQAFQERQVDGLIMSQLDFQDSTDAAAEKCHDILERFTAPIVSYGRNTDHNRPISVVAVDQVHVGYLATRYLLKQGHRRIGCAAGPRNLDVCELRYQGYRKALAEFGVEEDPSLICYGGFSVEGGMQSLPYLLGQEVTAIFAFNDLIAYGIYKESNNYNLSIPRDLSVVGVDDIIFSDIINPPLTSVAQPINEIADCLVDAILKAIQDPASCQSKELMPILKVRASTCAPGRKL